MMLYSTGTLLIKLYIVGACWLYIYIYINVTISYYIPPKISIFPSHLMLFPKGSAQERHLPELRPGRWRRGSGARVPQRLGLDVAGEARRRLGLERQGPAGGRRQAG